MNEYGHALTDGYIGAHIKEAEWAIRHIIDEEAWARAKSINTIESYQEYKDICNANNYQGYNWAHYNAACTNIGNLRKAEDIRNQKEKDNVDWNNAVRQNTVEAYNHYLNIHNDGIHKKEALDAIAKLEKHAFISQEKSDWQNACRLNTLYGYKSFVAKYDDPSLKYRSTHLESAKQKIEKLTPPAPVPTPIKWWKWIGIAVILVLGWLIYVQWHDNAWPFNIKSDGEGESDDVVQTKDTTFVVEEVMIPTQEYLDSIAYTQSDSINNNNQQESNLNNRPDNSYVETKEEVGLKESIKNPTSSPVSPTKDDLFKEAKKNKDYRAIENLAKQGYKPSYIYLAKHYLKNPATHNLAYKYAQLAKKAGVKEADEILKTLELYDF